ncbi:hypothetical protein O181_025805 [Austropuccinia psidii MF-1]|uniref:Uncharacterized protein n=1 Tax=Austropuccinia psidii MF-1 TaxID=1389203 RepID=A0A9Q3CNC7_9BASI|nr:hypothetical protein [Austropuccinia psidii MF-1]
MIHYDSTRTPYEIVSNLKPSLTLLHAFGANSYILNHGHRKHLGLRGIVGYHMGIAPDSKGWIFWVPKKALNLFYDSMIQELDKQDKFVASMNAFADQTTITPGNFKEISASNKQEMWMDAINKEIKSMED